MNLQYTNHYYLLNDYEIFTINLNFFLTFFFGYISILEILKKTRINKNIVNQLSIKIISCIHSVISFYGAYLYLYELIDYELWNNKYLMISKAYVIYDSIVLICAKQPIQYLFHHFIFYIGISFNFFDFSKYIAILLLAEITNINLNIGWLMVNTNYNRNIFFNINAFILLLLFFVFRVLNHIYISYITIFELFPKYGFKLIYICLFGLTFLQFYWFKKLLDKALNKN